MGEFWCHSSCHQIKSVDWLPGCRDINDTLVIPFIWEGCGWRSETLDHCSHVVIEGKNSASERLGNRGSLCHLFPLVLTEPGCNQLSRLGVWTPGHCWLLCSNQSRVPWKRPLRSPGPTPTLPTMPTHRVPRCHTSALLEHLQGW